MHDHQEQFEGFYLTDEAPDFDSYLSMMSQSTTYGTHLEWRTLSSVLNVGFLILELNQILLLIEASEASTICWHSILLTTQLENITGL